MAAVKVKSELASFKRQVTETEHAPGLRGWVHAGERHSQAVYALVQIGLAKIHQFQFQGWVETVNLGWQAVVHADLEQCRNRGPS
jgi:hypothetical protein